MQPVTLFNASAVATCILLLSGCQGMPFAKTTDKHVVINAPTAVKETYPVLPPAANMVRVTEGQRVTLSDKPVTLHFDKVVSDSRCPTDVKCIWAGNASIVLTVTPNNSPSNTLTLSTGDLRGDLVRKASVGGYDISLETLYPTPSATVNFDKLSGKYMADIKVVPTAP